MSFGNGNGNGEIVISTPLRTGIGTFGGSLKDIPATDLGATVGKEVLSRAGIEGDQVDQIIVGNILSAGQGMNPGRQVGIKSGLPVEVPGMTLNRMCGSGLQAVISAAQELNAQVTQDFFNGVINNLRTQADNNRALSEDLIEQQRKQQEASRALARESVNAYMDFLNSMFSYYRGSMDEVQRRANQ